MSPTPHEQVSAPRRKIMSNSQRMRQSSKRRQSSALSTRTLHSVLLAQERLLPPGEHPLQGIPVRKGPREGRVPFLEGRQREEQGGEAATGQRRRVGSIVHMAAISAISNDPGPLHRRRSAKMDGHMSRQTTGYGMITGRTMRSNSDSPFETSSSSFRQLRQYPILTTVFHESDRPGTGVLRDGHLSWGDTAGKPGAPSPFCCAG